MTIYEKLEYIQKNLKVPKKHINEFGKFNHRKCEDILEALKPLSDGYVFLFKERIIYFKNRTYIKCEVTMTDGKSSISAFGHARESEERKPKMDESQTTGCASSYARKYALGALLMLDDSDDPDTLDNSKISKQMSQSDRMKWLGEKFELHENSIKTSMNLDSLKEAWVKMLKDISPYKGKFTIADEFLVEIENIKDEIKNMIMGEKDVE